MAKPNVTEAAEEKAELEALHRTATEKRAEIINAISQYQPKPDPFFSRRDVVDNRYVVQLNRPLPDLDTQQNKAFEVKDEQEPDRQLYALICARHLPQRITVMAQMRNIINPHFVSPVAASLVELSTTGEQYFAIIFPRPAGRRLSALLAERKLPIHSEAFLRINIFSPLASILQQLEEMELGHGRINLDNMFFDNNHLVLGECVSEPAGYSQPWYYEPLERMYCEPAGKGDSDVATDYFALGILMLLLQPGKRFFVSLTPMELGEMIARKGTFNSLTDDEALPEGILDFLRGTLHDAKRDRWTSMQLKSWVAGKKFSVIMPTLPIEASRPYDFLDNGYLNRRALAHAFLGNWEKAIPRMRDGSVIRWVELSIGQKEIGAALARVLKACGGEKISSAAKLNDELVARSLNLLDPHGPMRLKGMSLHVEGIGCLLSEILHSNSQERLLSIIEVFEFDLANAWADVLKRHLDILLPTNLSNMLWKLDRLRVVMRSVGLGFGIERCLYELNPYYPCQSPLLQGKHVTTLPQLLNALDRLAPTKARDHEPMDRHIAAFITSRLNIGKEVRIPELQANKNLVTHRSLVMLKLLEQAQQKAGYPKLPGLSAWVAAGLFSLTEHLHSKTLREQVISMVSGYASGGQLKPMLEIMRSNEYVARDKLGFELANLKYRDNTAALYTLESRRVIRTHAMQVGNRIAYYVSFCILSLMLYFLFLNGGWF